MSEEPSNNPHRYYPVVAKTDHQRPLNEHDHYRYYPVTEKDHHRPLVKHEGGECTAEGMDTHTHTHRYVPAQKDEKKNAEVKNIEEENVEEENIEEENYVIDEVEA